MNLSEKIISIFPTEKEIPSQHNLEGALLQNEYLVNGDIKVYDGEFKDVYSPICINVDGELQQKYLGRYPLMSADEAMVALEAAKGAYDNGKGEWPTMSVEQRIACVSDFTFRMLEKREEVVKLLMWEIGKSRGDSEKEFDRTVKYIEDTIDALKELDRDSSHLKISEGVIAQIRRAPLGVTLCMGPFNYPLNETFTLLIPALIMGNTVVFKPPKFGVLLHRPFLEAFRDAFPRGVINTIYGSGKETITPIMQSGDINILAFIGGSKAASMLKHFHPKPHRLRSVLGLEAKNAGIVLPDADLELAVAECLTGSLSFNGQRCTALKILFVHENIVGSFVEIFKKKVSKIAIGMPWTPNVNITPLPEDGKIGYLNELIDDAKNKGADIINEHGGETNKTFMFPAVLFPVNKEMKVYHEEQFGPVVPIVAFRSIKTPLEYINESNYGQQVSIFGNNADEISKLIDPLVNQVARVNINAQCQRGPDTFPFTGRKDSAEGTLSVSDALRSFSMRSLVAIKQNDDNKQIITQILKEHKSNFLSTNFIL
jgi:glyceraldehyde-3-phosphate dehydrogenase (NADP+)